MIQTSTPANATLIGYARTSTYDQQAGLEAQRRDLLAEGCARIFEEHVSSVNEKERRALADALDYMRPGDTLVVTKIDRLARSSQHLADLLKAIDRKGAALRILNMKMDTGTPTGKMLITIMGSVAEFERDIMLERQREGIAKAKREKKYKGRKPTAQAKADEVAKLRAEGLGATEIARRLGIGRASVYRVLGRSGS